MQVYRKISPYEDRLRWDRLQLFNITLMVFLNSFGYEFQRTTNEKLIEVAITQDQLGL